VPNWIKIRTEYETTIISYRKIAEKHGVSFNTLKDRAKREGWAKSKQETQHKIATRTLQKAVVKEADRNARHIALLDLLLDKTEKVIGDELTIHIDMFGNPHKGDVIKVDKLEAAARILEKAQKGHRLALGMDLKTQQDITTQTNEHIIRLADLLNKPVADRPVENFEDEE